MIVLTSPAGRELSFAHFVKNSYHSFIYEVYGKNASHRKFIQNLKSVLKVFNEHLIASFEAFWSLKK